MIFRALTEIRQSDLNVDYGNGFSRRFLSEQDDMGFTLTDTLIRAGTITTMQNDRHLKACNCIEGRGIVETETETYELRPNVINALNQHEKHVLSAGAELRLIYVFNPPPVPQ